MSEAVWVAMGMVMSCHDLGSADALALMRGHAFGNRTDLDDVAERMVSGELPVQIAAETLGHQRLKTTEGLGPVAARRTTNFSMRALRGLDR